MKAQLRFRLRPIFGSTFDLRSGVLPSKHRVRSTEPIRGYLYGAGYDGESIPSNLFTVATLTLVARVDEQEYS